MLKNTVDFSIDCKGELTGNSYVGAFTAKTKLSMREILRQDELYRTLVGVNCQDASPAARGVASAVSYLSVHLVTMPDWWKDLDGGMKCDDLNLLIEINNKCQEVIETEYKKLSESGAEAEKALKALPQ